MNRPTLCLDFDGVIHSYTSGWKGVGNIPDPPVTGAFKFIQEAQDSGWTVAIYSTRSSSLTGRWAMKRWLWKHVIEEMGHDTYSDDLLCMIRWPWFKPPALMTIDDRAITFTGTWPDPAALFKFKPWNKP